MVVGGGASCSGAGGWGGAIGGGGGAGGGGTLGGTAVDAFFSTTAFLTDDLLPLVRFMMSLSVWCVGFGLHL